MTKYEGLDFVDLNNRLARKHPDQVERVDKFKTDDDARAAVSTAMQITGERLIRVLQPSAVRRGRSGDRLARYKDGMFASDLAAAFKAAGDNPTDVAGDLRYNEKAEIIKVYV